MAAFGVDGFLVGSLVVGFVDAVAEDMLGMVGGPAVGEEEFEVDVLVGDAGEDVVEVGPGFDAMPFGAGEDGEEDGGSIASVAVADEEPVFAFMSSLA